MVQSYFRFVLVVRSRRLCLRSLVTKRERAKKAFDSLWLQATERELYQCSLILSAVLDRETRASMVAYRQVLQDKLKNHHQNLGTIKCEFALEARRQWCCAEGLLKKEDRHLVTTLAQTLPTISDLGESSQDTLEETSAASPEGEKNSDEEAVFITPVPSTSGHCISFSESNCFVVNNKYIAVTNGFKLCSLISVNTHMRSKSDGCP